MVDLVGQVSAVARALTKSRIPFALGGALALAYATVDPRGTRDIDVNVFVPKSEAAAVLPVLPDGIRWDDQDLALIARDGQVRLWWAETPVDLFFSEHEIHERAAGRVRWVDFAGEQVPVLAPIDLAIFKVLFDRQQDWVDLRSMVDSGELDPEELAAEVLKLLGDDTRVARAGELGQA